MSSIRRHVNAIPHIAEPTRLGVSSVVEAGQAVEINSGSNAASLGVQIH